MFTFTFQGENLAVSFCNVVHNNRTSEDRTVKVKIHDPKKWESIKVGDKVRITYTPKLINLGTNR